MLLLFSRMLDLRGSRTHSPARAPSFSRACTAGAVICHDGACMIASLSHRKVTAAWTPSAGWCSSEQYDNTTPRNVRRRADLTFRRGVSSYW